MSDETSNPGIPALELHEQETGSRNPGGLAAKVLFGVALTWTLFQLYYASPLPFILGQFLPDFVLFNDTEARAIHLMLAIFLGYLAFPATKRSPRDRIPLADWVLAFVAAFCAAYLYIFYEPLAERVGAPTQFDIVIGILGLVVLLEATRRALGLMLVGVALFFLVYVFFGSMEFIPDALRWKGASLEKAASHFWLTTEGVFGIALGVSTSFVFLFVLFGSLLERAGGGNFFIQIAFALMGHLRGGPAKASVVASGLTGLISGSSIANVVTTGTFTVPLMKRVGLSSEKAGAIEVASSVNGQIMPPVMGAAAFLMVEYVGISYLDVIKHAFLPAILSYIALFYIVHLEALKAGMEGIDRPASHLSFWQRALVWVSYLLAFLIVAFVAYYLVQGLKAALPGLTLPVISVVLFGLYLVSVKFAAIEPDLGDPADALEFNLPARKVLLTGLHFILPVVVLVWALTVERMSPGLSAFWASILLIVITVSEDGLKAAFRGERNLLPQFVKDFHALNESFVEAARNMIGIALATGTAGIIVGAVSLTGIGQVLAEFVEIISLGNIFLVLVFTAVISLILGMGLPTTANYIVVSSLMVPVVLGLGTQSGFAFELIAIHLFVFYFGIMADVTPPVGLASFAAAAISKGDPIKTGLTAFYYSLRTAVLPFVFIFHPTLLLIGIHGPLELVQVVLLSLTGILVLTAALQNYFYTANKSYETMGLLIAALLLLAPKVLINQISPPWQDVPATEFLSVLENYPEGSSLKVTSAREDYDGKKLETRTLIRIPAGDGLEARLSGLGLENVHAIEGGIAASARIRSPFDDQTLFETLTIVGVEAPATQISLWFAYLPGLLLVGGIAFAQRRRLDGVMLVTT